MRSGGCTVQQALTSEAAAVVKQAVVLAKRRGHAQVTPLHVANAMMAASSGGGGGGGLLRAACLQSHSHPLQCKALELCFNVALNRLPSAASSILSHHSPYPAISNALVAAFKRAQAHQRRGGDTQNQQQQAALLTVKIELEQLIVSILDDPSVSRVMREAGFSSTQVKNNVEKAINYSDPPSSHDPTNKSKENKVVILEPSSPPPLTDHHNTDSNAIIETLLKSKKNKNLVVVGESISHVEKMVENLMERIERGFVPDSLKQLKFVAFPPFYTFCNVRRELVQQKIQELAFLVKSVVVGGGAVLYMGDLNWISEYRVGVERERERSYYCSVEHMIMEVGRLISGFGEIGRVWLMGIATFQTYMKCRNGFNSLEMIWRLQPITIPSNSLGLALVSHSGSEDAENSHDCASNFEGEALDLQMGPRLSSLPPWLKNESRRRLSHYNHQKCDSNNNRQPKSLERTLTLSSSSPSPSTSCFSNDHQHNPNLQNQKRDSSSPSNPSSTTNSPSSLFQKFKEFNAQNLNILCNALEEKVPWQKQIIPEIVGTLLQCRSRMLRRKEASLDAKEDTWLLFLGPDVRGKEEVARNLAKLVFGSYLDFVSIGSSAVEGFVREVSENPHRVFLLEGFEMADATWRSRMKRAMERGRMSGGDGEEFCMEDAIVVLSCSCLKQKMESVGEVEKGLDLNMSFGDENVDDFGIIENVDRVVVFKY